MAKGSDFFYQMFFVTSIACTSFDLQCIKKRLQFTSNVHNSLTFKNFGKDNHSIHDAIHKMQGIVGVGPRC